MDVDVEVDVLVDVDVVVVVVVAPQEPGQYFSKAPHEPLQPQPKLQSSGGERSAQQQISPAGHSAADASKINRLNVKNNVEITDKSIRILFI